MKRVLYHDQLEFIPGIEYWFNIWKLVNIINHSNRIVKKKITWLYQLLQKRFWQSWTPFVTKVLRKLEKEGNFLNLIKNICGKDTIKFILDEKINTFPPWLEIRWQGCPFSQLIQDWSSGQRSKMGRQSVQNGKRS